MGRRSSLASVAIDVDTQKQALPRPEPDTPFRILVLGDFSGRGQRGLFDPAWAGRRPVMVDPDNFEEVLARMAPELELAPVEHERAITLQFHELDDFHPDRLLDAVEPFCVLPEPKPAAAKTPDRQEAPPPASGADLLRQMLGEPQAAAPQRKLDEWDRLLHEIVKPYAVPAPDPVARARAATKEELSSAALRVVMHHPEFQALEAAWRGVFFLLQRIETSSELQIHLLDVSKAELAAALVFCDDIEDSAPYRELVEKPACTPGAHRWSVIAGLYSFDGGPQDQATLARMSLVARMAGAPFLAQASPRLLGCESLAAAADPHAWSPVSTANVRRGKDARWIGLALPRFLLRLPYGANGSSTERLRFEEMPDGSDHESYLWGNPALICTLLLAEAFAASGWEFRPGSVLEIEGLPAFVYHAGGESSLKECAEVLLTERAIDAMLEAGIMPLATIKNSDRARLMRFQSYAEPLAPLAGPWE